MSMVVLVMFYFSYFRQLQYLVGKFSQVTMSIFLTTKESTVVELVFLGLQSCQVTVNLRLRSSRNVISTMGILLDETAISQDYVPHWTPNW